MVCNIGDKPEITYQFSNKPERKYKSKVSPIEVITKSAPVPGTENYSNKGYRITFFSSQCFSTGCILDVRDYKIITYEGEPAVYPWLCGSDGYLPDLGGLIVLNQPNKTITKNLNSACQNEELQRCTIQVIHNGNVIFQDQGDCPIVYSIKCGNCPDGMEEIKTNIYPGYCCLDCEAVANEIKSITNQLRSQNNG